MWQNTHNKEFAIVTAFQQHWARSHSSATVANIVGRTFSSSQTETLPQEALTPHLLPAPRPPFHFVSVCWAPLSPPHLGGYLCVSSACVILCLTCSTHHDVLKLPPVAACARISLPFKGRTVFHCIQCVLQGLTKKKKLYIYIPLCPSIVNNPPNVACAVFCLSMTLLTDARLPLSLS